MSVVMKLVGATVVAVTMIAGGSVQARVDQPGAAQGSQTAEPPVPLKVTVTISRFDGDKKTSSLPYVLWVNTGREGSSIRMGGDVPVPTTVTSSTGQTTPSYSYRSVGTNIDCSASAIAGGLYRISLGVEDTQLARSPAGLQMGASSTAPVSYQRFRAQHQPILRDGQTVQFSVATDKTTGEVIKLDVTLNLVK